MVKKMTNEQFKERVLAGMVRMNDWPITLITTRQASKFRMKRGTLYRLWKALPKTMGGIR